MSIEFGGVGSGLPVNDWINAIMQAETARLNSMQTQKYDAQNSRTALNSVESKFSSFRTSLETLTDANLASSFDLFDRKKVTSSDTDIATATVSTNATIQNIELKVDSLATSTTAKSIDEAGLTITGTDEFLDLANGDAEKGIFTIYTDGIKNEIEIEEGDTLDNIITDINAISGMSAQITDGKFEISYDGSIDKVILGSSSDTSNFFNVMNLSTVEAQASTFTSNNPVSKVNLDGKIIGNEANLTGSFSGTYTFEIGNAEFSINSNTTLRELINNINSNDDAGVVASFDLMENKLKLTAVEPGSTAINLEDKTGDFLKQVNLIKDTGDATSSQVLGEDAVVYINGSRVKSDSNTLTGDISGLTGVTINLKNVTDGDTITLNVEQDTEKLTSAVEDFINKFNSIINDIDSKTASGKDLNGEYSLVSLRNTLRTMATGQVDGLSTYDSLAMIGISTGSVGKSVDESTKTLKLDKDKFIEALQDNPDEVKALLVGDSKNGITGVLQSLETKTENILDPVNGYFAAREDSFDSQIADLNKSIEREMERLDAREAMLKKQFSQMDQYISQMQQQSTTLSML